MNIKQQLANKQLCIGSWVNSASPIVAELMSSAGFDFLTVDAEHSAVDLARTQVLFQAIKSGNPGCVPIVRLAGNIYSETKRYMDAGAVGVIAPFINTAEQARELVRAVKYPPEGMRGVGFCRANGYGARLDEDVAASNSESFICVQIEHVRAVENINEILAVPGIDAVFIGPYDLSASMGITGQFDHPDYEAATQTVLKACQSHAVTPGIHVVQPDVSDVEKRYREGYRFIAYSLDITMLLTSCRKGLEEIQKLKRKE
jgi:2-dehydro-3-deoxyglucarate aldolase